MEYSAIKMDEALIHITKWMNLKNITLSKWSQTNTQGHMLYDSIDINVQKRQIHKHRK